MSVGDHQIHVAVGVIRNPDGKILIAKRPKEKHMGGLWEFPGGKIEAGESVQQALLRELREEVNIHCTRFENLIRIEHRYPDKHVVLDVQLVDAFTGEAAGKEGQEIKWVRVDDLENYTFPEANKPIITAVKLPRRFLITRKCLDINDFRSQLADDNGSGIIGPMRPAFFS